MENENFEEGNERIYFRSTYHRWSDTELSKLISLAEAGVSASQMAIDKDLKHLSQKQISTKLTYLKRKNPDDPNAPVLVQGPKVSRAKKPRKKKVEERSPTPEDKAADVNVLNSWAVSFDKEEELALENFREPFPIQSAVRAHSFSSLQLLYTFVDKNTNLFIVWLKQYENTDISIKSVRPEGLLIAVSQMPSSIPPFMKTFIKNIRIKNNDQKEADNQRATESQDSPLSNEKLTKISKQTEIESTLIDIDTGAPLNLINQQIQVSEIPTTADIEVSQKATDNDFLSLETVLDDQKTVELFVPIAEGHKLRVGVEHVRKHVYTDAVPEKKNWVVILSPLLTS